MIKLTKFAFSKVSFNLVRSLHISKMSLKGVRENWSCKSSPSQLLERANKVIDESRKVFDTIAAVSDCHVSYESILKAYGDVECEYTTKRYLLDKPQNFSTDPAIRDASTKADKILQEFDVETSMRKDIFQKLIALEKKNEDMKPEAKRYLEKLIKYGKRNGLHLSEENQTEIKSLKNRINDLAIQFQKHLNDECTTLQFSKEDLFGMPEDYLNGLEKLECGDYKVTLKYPDYFPIMRKCRMPDTRRKMYVAFQSRCIKENSCLLKEVVQLRHKLANLLGYPTHTSYVTEILMSQTQENVHKFLQELLQKMLPLWKEEKEYLMELKEKECKELNIPFDGKLNLYDLAFYTTLVENTKFSVDKTKLKEYFPLPKVTEGLLNIYQDILGLKFTEMKDVDAWHEDVKVYSVEDSKTKELFGYFYLDLFPRDGKYGHACVTELQPSCLLPDGTRQVAAATMLANFTKPQEDKPSLLDHEEVTTYFHEFGHLMHYICSQAEFVEFSGFSVEMDFVEAPSQMLENWCWEVDPLHKMSCHFKDQSAIPEQLLNPLLKLKGANNGYRTLVQIAYALFDFRIHSCAECDIKQVFNDTNKEVLGLDPIEETYMACSFGHLCGGYDAQYYSYLWSEVYSMDMFYTRFKDGKVLDPLVGMDYRKKILKPGSTKDAMDLLVDFLGRQPTQDAFLLSKGLKI